MGYTLRLSVLQWLKKVHSSIVTLQLLVPPSMAKKEFIWDVETSALEHANKPKEAKTQKCPHLFLIWHDHGRLKYMLGRASFVWYFWVLRFPYTSIKYS
jgi:hypothetical protein